MTIEITPNRSVENRSLVKSWVNMDMASLKTSSIFVRLTEFFAACVKTSRIFVSRLLRWLRPIYTGVHP